MSVAMGIVGVYSSELSAERSTAVEDSEMGGEEMQAARVGGGAGMGSGEFKVRFEVKRNWSTCSTYALCWSCGNKR